MRFDYTVDEEYKGRAVKSILKNKFGFSSKLIKKLKYGRKVFCNGNPVFVNHIVSLDDVVAAFLDFEEKSDNVRPEMMNLDIIYEDDSIIVLNKQPGIVVHPTSNHVTNTIANGLMYYFNTKNLKIKIRPVSRLDRDTSGIIVFAKNQFVQDFLIQQMSNGSFLKEYIGVVHGTVKYKQGTINLPIARKPGSIITRQISESGSRSVTHYSVLDYLNNFTLIKFILETGRTHQIRVHCEASGYPLVGDTLYSNIKTNLINRQALHAYKVKLIHPFTKETLELLSPIPHDIEYLLEILRK